MECEVFLASGFCRFFYLFLEQSVAAFSFWSLIGYGNWFGRRWFPSRAEVLAVQILDELAKVRVSLQQELCFSLTRFQSGVFLTLSKVRRPHGAERRIERAHRKWRASRGRLCLRLSPEE